MNIAARERSAIIRSAAYTWSSLQDGVDGRKTLIGLYCHNLEDKTPVQGALMARELSQWMARFQDCYDAVLEDPEGYPEHVLQEALGVLPLEQQFQILERLVRVWGPGGSPDTVGVQTREALLAQALASLPTGADALEQYLPPAGADELQERERVQSLCGQDMALAVNAMTCYTLAQNGALPPLPGDGSLAQAAAGVCAEDLLRGIIRDEQEGYLRESEAAQRRCALLTAFRLTLLLAGAAMAGGLAALTVPALGLLGALGVCGGLLAALGEIVTEKFRIDCRMLEEETDDLPPVSLELPHCAAPWPGKRTARASDPEAEQDQPQEETQESPEEYLFRPF